MKINNFVSKLKHVGYNTFNKLKHGYNNAVNVAKNIDYGVQTAKKIYDELSPLIKPYIGKNINNSIKNNLGENYNQIRDQVINKNNELLKIGNVINKYNV